MTVQNNYNYESIYNYHLPQHSIAYGCTHNLKEACKAVKANNKVLYYYLPKKTAEEWRKVGSLACLVASAEEYEVTFKKEFLDSSLFTQFSSPEMQTIRPQLIALIGCFKALRQDDLEMLSIYMKEALDQGLTPEYIIGLLCNHTKLRVDTRLMYDMCCQVAEARAYEIQDNFGRSNNVNNNNFQ